MTVSMRGHRARRTRTLSFLATAAAAAATAIAGFSATSWAASGSWNTTASGDWSNPANWTGGTVADGLDNTATFNLDLPASATTTVHLDSARTIGNLLFGDTAAATAGGWVVDNKASAANILTLALTTGSPTITVNALGTGQTATISAELAGTAGFTKAGAGTLVLTGVNTYTGATTVNAGIVTLGVGGAISSGSVQTLNNASGARFVLDGGSLTATATSNINNNGSAGGFLMNSGTANFTTLQTSAASDGGLIRIDGGTFNASVINIQRSSNTGNSNTTPTSGQTTSGLYINGAGANVTVGDLRVSTSNAGATARIDNGTVTVSNSVVLGGQNNAGAVRWSILDVNGGSLTVNGAAGITIGADSADHSERAVLLLRNGVATTEKIAYGDLNTLTSGRGVVVVNGGTLYVGSGGIVRNADPGYLSLMNLTAGTLGAKADWSTSQAMVLDGSSFTIKAADAAEAAHDIAISGDISGNGGFTKSGGGTLALTGNNSYLGSVTVAAGGLSGTTASLRNNIANAGVVTFDQATNGTYAGTISGTGSLVKSGSGAIVMPGAHTYSGATTINGGSLRLTGPQQTSGVTVANGAGLATGNGGATINALTLGSAPGDAMSLMLNSGSGLAPLAVSSLNGLVANGTTTIDVGIAGFTVGQHVLVDYNGAIGGAGYGGFTLGTLPSRVTANLVNNTSNGSVDLNVTLVDFPTWTGQVGVVNNGTWDINTTNNWKETTSGNTTTYLENTIPGDQVLFTDAATGTTDVDISTTVQPTFVTVNNTTKSYSFNGAGRISGPGGLRKQGAGSLTVNNAGNDYTGATTIEAGTLVLGNNNVLSDNSPIVVSGGTLDVNNKTDTVGPVTLSSGTIAAAGGGSGVLIAPSYDLRSGTVVASLGGAGALNKTTAGAVNLNTAAFYSGATNIQEGTLKLGGGDNTIPTTTTLTLGSIANTSGTLDLNGFNQWFDRIQTTGSGTANSITNTAGGGPVALILTGISTSTFVNNYAGSIDGNIRLIHSGTEVLALSGTSSYTGGTLINFGGVLQVASDAALGAVPASPTTSITFQDIASTLRAGAASVNLSANRNILIDGVTANFDSGGGANTMTINGVIEGGGFVGKTGNGTVIFNNANTYSGGTTIAAGNLRAGNNNAFSAGTIRVTGASASLQLADGITLTNNLISQSNTENMVDVPVAAATATFAGNVTVETVGSNGQYRVAANGAGATLVLTGSALLPNTFIVNAGSIIMSGSASIASTTGATATNNLALLGRPNTAVTTMSLTMRDNTSAAFLGSTNLGNARNMTDLQLNLQDNAQYSTAGTFTILDTTAATANSQVNLNGAGTTLTSGPFLMPSTGAGRTASINFNGGTLKAASASTVYLPAVAGLSGKVQNGGAIIDTNGFDITVAAPLEADGSGGLSKNGAGALTLAGANTYSGPTAVNTGTLKLENNLTTSSAVSVNNATVLEVASGGGSNRVLKTPVVTIIGTGKIDLRDNKLITGNAPGTSSGGTYSGIQGEVQRANNFGAWDQPGLTTSMPDAIAGLTTIAVATGEQIRGLGPTDTDTFAGQTITGASTIAMYTYAGDANLDGTIDGGDYGIIDNFAQIPGADGYANGDFNYDSVIDGGDYGIIDNNAQAQGAPFPTSGSAVAAGLSGVTAVPEPASLSAIAMGATALLGRRRRRRVPR